MHKKNLIFLIDNVTDGFSLYSVESSYLIHSYPTKLSSPNKVKQITFREKGVIMGG